MASRSAAVRMPASSSKTRADAVPARAQTSTLLTIATLSLVLLGLIMILSASSVASFATYGSSFRFFNRQLIWAVVGVVGFFVVGRIDYRKLKGLGYVAFAGVIALLVAVLIPGIGVISGGSARWLSLGPLSFQPSEVAKLALVLFAADVFSRKEERTLEDLGHTLLPMIPALGFLALLVMMQPDLGTTILLGTIGLGMLFIAGAPMRYLVPVTLMGTVIALVAGLAEDYRRERILAFLDPWKDPLNTGYQVIQSLIALGSGGWLGVGLGASRQKWSYIPNAHTDFIYAILGEETGLLGTLVVLGMFAFIAYLGIKTARNAPDRYGMFIAAGITIWITIQALVNMGAVTSTLPITGVPLPLVSFGGTSLVISMIAMGLLCSIARQSDRPASKGSRARSKS
jgi:cell division protein FtsW